MGKSHCGSKKGINQGAWNGSTLSEPIRSHGDGGWRNSPVKRGLKRCGKNCTLGSMNYLRPRIKRRNFSSDEEELILRLHRLLGNRWSLIAGRLPGRTDNEIKNHWNTYLSKKLATNECQAKGSHSLKTRPESPAAQNHAFKTIPVKTKAVRYSELLRSNGCNIYGDNSRPDQSLKLSDVKEFDVADHSFNVADNRAGTEE